MKRNLLIGTSLVAAFATNSLSARAAGAIDKASYDLNTQIVAAHVVAEKALAAEVDKKVTPLKAESGSTLLAATFSSKAGRKILADVLKSKETDQKTLKTKFADLKDKKAAIAEIAKALATNAELRKLVDTFRPQVVAAVKAENEAKDKKVVPGKVVPGPVVDEVTFDTLSKAVVDSRTALEAVIKAEALAHKNVASTTADVTAATAKKADAEKAFEAAETALKDAKTKAADAKTATDKATEELTKLNADHKAKVEAIDSAEKAIAAKVAKGTAVTPAETNAVAVLKAELGTIDAKIVSATTAQTETAATLKDADKAVVDAKAAVETAAKTRDDAVKALKDAEKAKEDAATALTTKTAAVTEATSKLEAANKEVLEAAEKAKTDATAKAKAATETAGKANVAKAELATAAETAKAKVTELTAREGSLKAELEAAKAADKANSTEATKATVKTKHETVAAIGRELLDANAAAEQANDSAAKAVEAAAKAVEAAAKAVEAKVKAEADVKAAKSLVESADNAIKALKAEIKKTVQADADAEQAKKAKADAEAAIDKVAKVELELADLEDKLKADPENAELKKAVAAKKAELVQAKEAADRTALALKNVTEAAEKSKAELAKAQQATSEAQEKARILAEQLKDALAEKERLKKANSDFATDVSPLTADAAVLDSAKVLQVSKKEIEAMKAAAEQAVVGLEGKLKALPADADETEKDKLTDALTAAKQKVELINLLMRVVDSSVAGVKGVEGKYSAATAKYLNNAGHTLRSFLAAALVAKEGLNYGLLSFKEDGHKLDMMDFLSGFINDKIIDFVQQLNVDYQGFNAVKGLIDADLTSSEVVKKLAAIHESVPTLVGKLQTMFKNEKIAEANIAGILAINERLDNQKVKDLLETLEKAVNKTEIAFNVVGLVAKLIEVKKYPLLVDQLKAVENSIVQENTVFEFLTPEARTEKATSAFDAKIAELTKKQSELNAEVKKLTDPLKSDGKAKVQNLTAETMKALKTALDEYAKFQDVPDIKLVSADAIERIFGRPAVEASEDHPAVAAVSGAEAMKAFIERTGLRLANVAEDIRSMLKANRNMANAEKRAGIEADLETLRELRLAVVAAREEEDKKRTLTAKLAEAVNTILSPAPVAVQSEHPSAQAASRQDETENNNNVPSSLPTSGEFGPQAGGNHPMSSPAAVKFDEPHHEASQQPTALAAPKPGAKQSAADMINAEADELGTL